MPWEVTGTSSWSITLEDDEADTEDEAIDAAMEHVDGMLDNYALGLDDVNVERVS